MENILKQTYRVPKERDLDHLTNSCVIIRKNGMVYAKPIKKMASTTTDISNATIPKSANFACTTSNIYKMESTYQTEFKPPSMREEEIRSIKEHQTNKKEKKDYFKMIRQNSNGINKTTSGSAYQPYPSFTGKDKPLVKYEPNSYRSMIPIPDPPEQKHNCSQIKFKEYSCASVRGNKYATTYNTNFSGATAYIPEPVGFSTCAGVFGEYSLFNKTGKWGSGCIDRKI